MASGVTLQGVGRESVLLRNASTSTILTSAANDVTIKDFRFDKAAAASKTSNSGCIVNNLGGNNWRIEDCIADFATSLDTAFFNVGSGAAVWMDSVRFTNCYFADNEWGIRSGYVDLVTVSNCYFNALTQGGILVVGTGTGTTVADKSRLVCTGSVFYDCQTSHLFKIGGIVLDNYGEGVVITGNYFYDSDIHVDRTTTHTDHTVGYIAISGNFFKGGLIYVNGDYVALHNYAHIDMTITGNALEGTTIDLNMNDAKASGYADFITIVGNAGKNGANIDVDHGDNIKITGNTGLRINLKQTMNCTITACTVGVATAIVLDASDNCVIQDCHLTFGNPGNVIFLDGSDYVTLQNNVIEAFHNGDTGCTGILMQDSYNLRVINNKIRNCATASSTIAGTVTFSECRGNEEDPDYPGVLYDRLTQTNANSASVTIGTQEMNRLHTNIGRGSATTAYTLPPAVTGMWVEFLRGDTGVMTVDPNGTENFRGLGAGAIYTIVAQGDVVRFRACGSSSAHWEFEMITNGGLRVP
jgi:hypothetical protein